MTEHLGLQAKALTIATGATFLAGVLALTVFQLGGFEVRAATELASVRQTIAIAEQHRVSELCDCTVLPNT